MEAFLGRQKGGHGPKLSMCRPWKLETRTRHCSLFVTECGVLGRSFWQGSRLIRSSHILRCQIILLESQPGKQSSRSKRSREITTEPIAA